MDLLSDFLHRSDAFSLRCLSAAFVVWSLSFKGAVRTPGESYHPSKSYFSFRFGSFNSAAKAAEYTELTSVKSEITN